MKIKIIFLCVLSLIIYVLLQYDSGYTVDFGADYASLMSTSQSHSEINVVYAKCIMIDILGVIIVISAFMSCLFLYSKACKISLAMALIPFLAVCVYSYLLTVAIGFSHASDAYSFNIAFMLYLALASIVFLVAKSLGASYKGIFIFFTLFLILYPNTLPCGKRSYWQARQKACYSNLRILMGAVEMYNMDAEKTNYMQDFDMEKMETLLKRGYLKSKVLCPEYIGSEYMNFGNLAEEGEISCGIDPIGGSLHKQGEGHGILSGIEQFQNSIKFKKTLDDRLKRVFEIKERKKIECLRNYSLSDSLSFFLGKTRPF